MEDEEVIAESARATRVSPLRVPLLVLGWFLALVSWVLWMAGILYVVSRVMGAREDA